MKLLATTPASECPAEALLARLRSRRADVEAHEAGLGESIDWVYRHLNKRLRKRLAPFLEVLAMQQLILIGRYQLAGETPPESLRTTTLLATPLQELMTGATTAETRVAQLEAILVADYPFVNGLQERYRAQGPGGVEQQLAGGILQQGLARTHHAVIEALLRYLIDRRNILAVTKFWRWQVSQPPPLLENGTLSPAVLQRIWTGRDEQRLAAMTRRRARESTPGIQATRIEQILINGLSRLLRRAGRDPLGLAVIIDYLWRVQRTAHNRLLQQTLPTERSELLEEVLLP